MDERPLARPEHLRDAPHGGAAWLRARPLGLAALVLGLVSFAVVAVVQRPLWSTPDACLSVPGFVAAAIAALASIVRRERAHTLWLIGLGAAGAALVLGWFLLVAIVIGATAIVMLILHSVM